MADKAPTREEMDKLYESFKDETPPGVMLPMGKEGTKKIMKKLKKIRGMEMGGEVMDTTKSMPVGMMDGGKVKPMKMNMGGVVPGRGGSFKGVR